MPIALVSAAQPTISRSEEPTLHPAQPPCPLGALGGVSGVAVGAVVGATLGALEGVAVGATSGGVLSGGNGGSGDACPQAKTLLDVSKAPGAGSGYPAPTLSGYCTETTFVVDSNDMPTYKFVQTTPNDLKAVPAHYEIPRFPQVASTTTDVPLLGYAAFAVNGIMTFGPTEGPQPADQAYGDPVYNGLMDPCQGHTAESYHYHSFEEKCLTPAGLVSEPWTNPDPAANTPSPIIGWAADGFPIYGMRECKDEACSAVVEMKSGYEKTGDPKTNAWNAYAWKEHAGDTTYLDECNGHTGPKGDYHYHNTKGFPYVLGCFRGTPMFGQMGGMDGGMPPQDGGMMGPKSCTTSADCAGACPPGSPGCTCANTPMGMICVPTCTTSADCPMGPNGMPLTCKMGVCAP